MIGPGVTGNCDELHLLTEADLLAGSVGRNVRIRCREFGAIGRFDIEDDVEIEAERIVLGDGARIGRGTRIRAIAGVTKLFGMGDHALVDERSNIMVPEFICGDYTRIFRDALISGYKPFRIGHNGWVGQGAILNSAELLVLGNNVRMGGSQIWTHVASGELLEGSRFASEAPVTLCDNVWLMGFGHMISPGVTLAEGTVVMANSTVTKSTQPWHTYSGSPAQDITDKLPAWAPLDPVAKWALLGRFVDEFLSHHADAEGRVILAQDETELARAQDAARPSLIFTREVRDWDSLAGTTHSVFELASKTYVKQRTPLEVAWHLFANGMRARFIPREPRPAQPETRR